MILKQYDAFRGTNEERKTIVEIARLAGVEIASTATWTFDAIYLDKRNVICGCAMSWSPANWLSFQEFVEKLVAKEPKFEHGSQFKDSAGNVYTLKQQPCHSWVLEMVKGSMFHYDGHELTLDEVQQKCGISGLVPVN